MQPSPEVVAYRTSEGIICSDPICLADFADLLGRAERMTQADVDAATDGKSIHCFLCCESLDAFTRAADAHFARRGAAVTRDSGPPTDDLAFRALAIYNCEACGILVRATHDGDGLVIPVEYIADPAGDLEVIAWDRRVVYVAPLDTVEDAGLRLRRHVCR